MTSFTVFLKSMLSSKLFHKSYMYICSSGTVESHIQVLLVEGLSKRI